MLLQLSYLNSRSDSATTRIPKFKIYAKVLFLFLHVRTYICAYVSRMNIYLACTYFNIIQCESGFSLSFFLKIHYPNKVTNKICCSNLCRITPYSLQFIKFKTVRSLPQKQRDAASFKLPPIEKGHFVCLSHLEIENFGQNIWYVVAMMIARPNQTRPPSGHHLLRIMLTIAI